MSAVRPGARGGAPRHLQARRRGPLQHRHARLPRRGAALDRLHRPPLHRVAPARGAGRAARSSSTAAPRRPCGRQRSTAARAVEVRELFSATPARLKFLKSERAENLGDLRGGQAPRHGAPASRLHPDHRRARRPQARRRSRSGPTATSPASAASWAATSSTMRLPSTSSARACASRALPALPTLHRPDPGQQYLFVNGRPVKDRLLIGAVRAAYGDLLPEGPLSPAGAVRGRFPRARSTSTCIRARPRCASATRGACAPGRRRAAGRRWRPRGHRATAAGGMPARSTHWSARRPATAAPPRPVRPRLHLCPGAQRRVRPAGFAEDWQAPLEGLAEAGAFPSADARASAEPPPADLLDRPLGAARAQLHETYIVAQTRTSVVIVDQHAAHERLVYERLKAALANGGVARQGLLIPEIVEVDARRGRSAGRARGRARPPRACAGGVRGRRRAGARGAGAARRHRRQGPRARPGARGARRAARAACSRSGWRPCARPWPATAACAPAAG